MRWSKFRAEGILPACGLALALVLATGILFQGVSGFEFLHFDDNLYVTENLGVLRGWDSGVLMRAVTENLAGNWQPLTYLSHALDVQLFGRNPGAHHLVNLILHLINTLLLFAFALAIRSGRAVAFFVSALFAIHPLRIESVAWIAERKDLLCGVFFFLALLVYVRFSDRKKPWMPWLLAGLMCLGLLAKPMLVTLPFVLLLLDYWPLGSGSGISQRRWSQLVLEKTPLFVVAAAFCVITLFTQADAGAVRDLTTIPFVVRVETAIVAYTGYLGNFLWPVSLSPFYKHPLSWPLWQVGACLLGLVVVTVLVVAFRKEHPWWLLGWLWYLGMLVPVIGLVQVGDQWMADRYTYLPMVGIALAIGFEAKALAQRNRWGGPLLATIGLAWLAGLWVLTSQQLPIWKDSASLSRSAIERDGGHWSMRTNQAIAFAEAGNLPASIAAFEGIYRDYPADPETLNNLGFALLSSGSAAKAIPFFKKAVAVKGDYFSARVNLGRAYLATRNPREALEQFEFVISADPADPAAYAYAGLIFAVDPILFDSERARVLAESAIKKTPGPNITALEVLALAHSQAGRKDDARQAYLRARQAALDTGSPDVAAKFQMRADALK